MSEDKYRVWLDALNQVRKKIGSCKCGRAGCVGNHKCDKCADTRMVPYYENGPGWARCECFPKKKDTNEPE